VRLQVDAARVEADALADESNVPHVLSLSGAVAQPDDSSIPLVIGACDGEECAGIPPPQRCLIEEIELPALAASEIAQRLSIAARVQDIRRQRCEPAGEVIAAIDRDRASGVELRTAIEQRERSGCGSLRALLII
jgi:hypothetical protein